MTGFIELAVMVFALAISFSVYLVHKGVKEKEAGLSILAIILFIASALLTFMIIYKVINENSIAGEEITLPAAIEDVTTQ
jgi:hypothetical protein